VPTGIYLTFIKIRTRPVLGLFFESDKVSYGPNLNSVPDSSMLNLV
jgi:hypothetical protein